MKNYITLVIIAMFYVSHTSLNSMEQEKGPMDSVWFYDKNHAFAQANQYHQEQQWKKATEEYINCLFATGLGEKVANALKFHIIYGPSKYDKNKAYLNLAACLMAQRKSSELWTSFDVLLNIPLSQRISSNIIQNALQKTSVIKSIIIRTDQSHIRTRKHPCCYRQRRSRSPGKPSSYWR